ncbi:MAG: radical SAM family heme chaperone HemW [Spirochaetaceae bacterium]
MRRDISAVALKKMTVPLSLYLHIPFCGKKCGYCDFFSLDTANVEEQKRTIDTIIEDTEEFLSILTPPILETVYIGGGTPNSLPEGLFSELLYRLRAILESFGSPLEWTVEANPEFLSEGQLEVMKSAGVTRISLGVQSFDNEKLRLIGRGAAAKDAENALLLLSEKWRGDWSADLITLLPGIRTGEASPTEDIDKILSYSPEHLSLYGLTLEPETPLFREVKRGAVLLPEEGKGADTLRRQWNVLEEAGFTHYEVSNFAKGREKESLHNFRYWRLAPYLGIGPSAASTLPGEYGPMRLRFCEDLGLYNDKTQKRAEERIEAESVSPYSFLIEHILTGLRTREGVSFTRIAEVFGRRNARHIFRKIEAKLDHYSSGGFIEDRLERGSSTYEDFRVSDSGLMILDSLILDLSAELDTVPLNRCRWP